MRNGPLRGVVTVLVVLFVLMLLASTTRLGPFFAVQAVFSVLLLILTFVLPILFIYWFFHQATAISSGAARPARGTQAPPAIWIWPGGARTTDHVGAWLREAEGAAAEIGNLVRSGGRATREALRRVPESADRLVEHVRALSRLYHELSEHLENADESALRRRATDGRARRARRRPARTRALRRRGTVAADR